MPDTKPLTAKEKSQLDNWTAHAGTVAPRAYIVAAVAGFVGGAWMDWSLTAGALAAGGSSTLTQSFPFLLPVESAIGTLWTSVLTGGVLFSGGMLVVAWRIVRAMRATHETLRVRYIAAGVEDVPPPVPPAR